MKLAKREKLFIGAAVFVLGIFLILTQVVFPFFDEKKYLEKDTKNLEKYIAELDKISAQGTDINEISSNSKGFLMEPLYTFINKAAVAMGLEPELNPSEEPEKDGYIEEKCEVKLHKISDIQLKDFLFRIEKPEKNIFISTVTTTDVLFYVFEISI